MTPEGGKGSFAAESDEKCFSYVDKTKGMTKKINSGYHRPVQQGQMNSKYFLVYII